MYIARTERERSYMHGLASVYQSDSLVDAATAAIPLIESDVIDCIEVDTSIRGTCDHAEKSTVAQE